MNKWLFVILILSVNAQNEDEKRHCNSKCVGKEYECIDGFCFCARNYTPNYFQTRCVECPVLGERCYGTCCNSTLQCWHGVCQSCYNSEGNWNCRSNVDQLLLISTTQIVMGAALVLGIVATLMLLLKLCATTDLRPLGNRYNYDNRLSIGSFQVYVEERLRDPPPRYSNTPQPQTTALPAIASDINNFNHIEGIPPPPYTEELKYENNQNATLHI